jgi:MFS family permease
MVIEPENLPPETVPINKAVALRHNKNFRRLWIGQVLSDLGTNVGSLCYTLLTFALTGSALISGTVSTVASAAAFLVRLPAGSLADRLDKRRAMIICDTVRALVLGLLAALVAIHEVDWELVLVVAVIDRIGDTLFSPASSAAIPLIVPDDLLESAFAASEARQYGTSLAGPSLGGFLFNLGRTLPFLGDAASYAVSVVTSLRLTGDYSPRPTEGTRKGLWREAVDGLTFISKTPRLRAVVIQAPLLNFAFNGIIYGVILGMRVNGKSAATIGFVQSLIMVGGLLGAIAAPRLQGKFTLRQQVLMLSGPGAILMGVAAFLMPSPLLALPIAIVLFIAPASNASIFAAMLRMTPPELQGRVTNSLLQLATMLAVFSPLVVGTLLTHVSAQWTIGAFASVLVVSTVIALSSRGLRALDRDEPTPAPPAAE